MTPDLSPRRDDPVAVAFPELQNFSLVLGGPLWQLLRKARMDDDAGRLVGRRIVLASTVIWLPLLVLCAIEGTLLGGVDIPFLPDIETHARFLVGVPLMILAELVVHQRLRGIVAQFVERGLVPAASMERFIGALRRAMAWRNSWFVEIVLIALVYTVGHYIRDYIELDTSSWYATVGTGPAPARSPRRGSGSPS